MEQSSSVANAVIQQQNPISYMVGNVGITLVLAYIILIIFLIKPLRPFTKTAGLGLAFLITGFAAYLGANVSSIPTYNWLGWGIGMAFVTWRVRRKS